MYTTLRLLCKVMQTDLVPKKMLTHIAIATPVVNMPTVASA